MKVGIRTPSIKKSVKARTTGRIKREIKGAVNPLYGKKGMGYIKNPERAIKNKIYHKVTVSALDVAKEVTKDRPRSDVLHEMPISSNVSGDKPRPNRIQSIILGIAFSIIVLSFCIFLFVMIFT